MWKKSCFHLLTVCVIFSQGIAVSSGGNRDGSSALLIRQKRASSSITYNGLYPHERPSHNVGLVEPPRWQKRLLPGMVRIYQGNREVGLGVVAQHGSIVTKAHFFPKKFHLGEFHVEYRGQDGMTVSHDIETVRVNKLYRVNNEDDWGPNDVCIADTNGQMPKAKYVSQALKATRLFTRDQIFWIGSRTGCLEAPGIYDL